MKNISILGSTGSIGTQALEVIDICNDIKVQGISCNSNIDLFEKQIRKYKPEKACIMDESLYKDLKVRVMDLDVKICTGIEGLVEIATLDCVSQVLTSVVGNIGLLPTIEAIKEKKDILLANKETLVTSGSIIMPLAKEKGVKILPVDSEHSAIFQSIQGEENNRISKILLTASGGPFFNKNKEELESVTKNDALKHPNWSMGAKITIDSSTMMNKGLEVIEAKWLFGVDSKDIEVYIHRQSIVHSMVEFSDNSIIAQLGIPDMKIPIVYAMRYPKRDIPVSKKLNLFDIHSLTFEKPDIDTFKCLSLAYDAINIGGTMPCVLNASNEIAVSKFLKDEISFLEIPYLIKETMNAHTPKFEFDVNDILNVDLWARQYCDSLIKR